MRYLVLPVVALVLAACGSSDESTEPTPTPSPDPTSAQAAPSSAKPSPTQIITSAEKERRTEEYLESWFDEQSEFDVALICRDSNISMPDYTEAIEDIERRMRTSPGEEYVDSNTIHSAWVSKCEGWEERLEDLFVEPYVEEYPAIGDFLDVAHDNEWFSSIPHDFESEIDTKELPPYFDVVPYAIYVAEELKSILAADSYDVSRLERESSKEFVDAVIEMLVPQLDERVDEIEEDEKEEKERREGGFRSGDTHVVGEEIDPGTYRAECPDGKLIDDAYWERTSASGNIIANDFVTSAQQITVTIKESDGQFTSSGACYWYRVD